MPRATWYLVVGLLALLVPAALALLVFPTPSSDTRELFAWGHFFTLSTAKHPPMMQWIGGATEWLLAPSAFWAVVVTQVLNAAGLAYTYATARLTVERDQAAFFTLLLATSVYVIAGPLPFALNADVLQFPFWAAIVFHAVKAAQTNRPLHWICLGLGSAAAAYTKYTALVLFLSLAAASLAVADFRGIWRRPGLYLAALIGAGLLLPHILSVRDTTAIGHATGLLEPETGIVERATNLMQIAIGVLLWLAPAWIFIAVGFLRRDCVLAVSSASVARFLRATCLSAFGFLILLVAVLGLKYESRYDSPFLFLIVLGAATLIGFDRDRWAATEQRTLRAAVIAPAATFALAILVYGVFTGHDYMQEPAGQAASIVQSDWSAKYRCGPAYIMGDVWSAYGLAIANKQDVVGVPLGALHDLQWYDPLALKRLGAIVVYRDQIDLNELETAFPGLKPSGVRSFTLPLLRSFANRTLTYVYFFIPPEGCFAANTP